MLLSRADAAGLGVQACSASDCRASTSRKAGSVQLLTGGSCGVSGCPVGWIQTWQRGQQENTSPADSKRPTHARLLDRRFVDNTYLEVLSGPVTVCTLTAQQAAWNAVRVEPSGLTHAAVRKQRPPTSTHTATKALTMTACAPACTVSAVQMCSCLLPSAPRIVKLSGSSMCMR